ncbi:MAG: hypothetical protein F6J93_21765 [Oscillatoria sp. SIO1A7]|nr:hypothetical protein [Oscillatoria sp. SIO1A7]
MWLVFGWLADYSFPYGQVIELTLACFKGTIAAKINSLQKQIQRTDVVTQADNKRQVQKLNNLESRLWLYEGILDRLGADTSTNHESIAKTIEALEYKRNTIIRELEPRKPRRYRLFDRIQGSARLVLVSRAPRDYEHLDKIVTNLTLFAKDRQPSQTIISEAIDKLAAEIKQNANQISPYRLRLAYKIDELMKTLSDKLALGYDSPKSESSDRSVIDDLQSRINVLEKERDRLASERSELQRQNQSLDQTFEHQQNLIDNLSQELESIYSYNKEEESKDTISEEEYEDISNKDDYIYVRPYTRKNGTPVKGYYRRKGNK